MGPTLQTRTFDKPWRRYRDDADSGRDAGWFRGSGLPEPESVDQPLFLSRTEQSAGSIWYSNEFVTEPGWEGRSAFVAVEVFHATVEVWVNGESIGAVGGQYDAAAFAIGEGLKPPENTITLCLTPYRGSVTDLPDCWGLVDAPTLTIGPRDTTVLIQPDVRRNRVTLRAETDAPIGIRAAIDGTPCNSESETGDLSVEFPDFTAWSPDTPSTYSLHSTLLQNGEVLQEQVTLFGMRSLRIQKGEFKLNGRAITLRGLAYPIALCTDRNRRQLSDQLALIKSAGFNLIHVLDGPAPNALLTEADRSGLMVAQCLSPWLRSGNSIDICRKFVALRCNHPSLIMWTWAPVAELGDELRACIDLVRQADPSRILFQIGGGDDEHPPVAFLPYKDRPVEVDTWEGSILPPPARACLSRLENIRGSRVSLVTRLRLNVLGGRVGGPLEEVEAAHRFHGLSVQSVLDAMRRNPNLSGYIVHAQDPLSSDFEHVFRAVHAPIRPLIRIGRANALVRKEVPISVSLSNESRYTGRAELSLQVVGPTNQVLWKKKRFIQIVPGLKEIWDGNVSASGTAGPHRFVTRITDSQDVLAEAAVEFSVLDPTSRSDASVQVVDPRRTWEKRCADWVRLVDHAPSVYVVPPLANTIGAYPPEPLHNALAQVREGAVAIFFEPPEDWNTLADRLDPAIRATSVDLRDSSGFVYHHARLHPIFDGLGGAGLLGLPYAEVTPVYAFQETSEEAICAVTREPVGPRPELGATEESARMADILVKRYGSGRLVFAHFRILDRLDTDPVAQRLFVNFVNHFSRRSVPPKDSVPINQECLEWHRQERSTAVRRWAIIGPFANWDNEGHDVPYPPEQEIDPHASYPGWYKAVTWSPWFTRAEDMHTVHLTESLRQDRDAMGSYDPGTAYCYTEITTDRRGDAELVVEATSGTRIWINGKVAPPSLPDGPSQRYSIFLRQGKNTVLVKLSYRWTPQRLRMELHPVDPGTQVSWWK